MYSLWLSAKPRDANHPYGHGKVEFISSGIEGVLISLAAILIWVELIQQWSQRSEIIQLDKGILLVVLTAFINLVVGLNARSKGRKERSIALESSGQHLITDAFTTFGISGGLAIAYFTNWLWLDGVIAMILSIYLIYTGIKIIRRSVSGIMDEADDDLLEELIAYVQDNRRDNWIDLHNLRVIKYGPVYHVDCHLTVPWYFSVREGHDELTQFEDLIRHKYGETVELFVHIDDCYPFSCEICNKANCSKREHPFVKTLEWNVPLCSRNGRHQLGKETAPE